MMLVLLLLALLGYVFVIGPSQDCGLLAAITHRPYLFHPLDGCWLQSVEGNWQRVDPHALPDYQP